MTPPPREPAAPPKEATLTFRCSKHGEQKHAGFTHGGVVLLCGCSWYVQTDRKGTRLVLRQNRAEVRWIVKSAKEREASR